jgi:hypothetical protein
MQNALTATTAIVPADYNGWNDNDGDAAGRLIQGELIKCVDGRWSLKDGTAPPKRLIAMATTTGLQLWKDRTPVQTIIKRPGAPWPNLDDLNAEIPQEDWEIGLDGQPRAPWQRQFVVYFLDPDTAVNYTFANGTTGASMAVSDLKNAVKWQRAIRGDHVVPLIELASKPMKTKFGQKQRPHFQIIEWRNLDIDIASTPAAAPKALPNSIPPSSEYDDGAPFNDGVDNLPFDR